MFSFRRAALKALQSSPSKSCAIISQSSRFANSRAIRPSTLSISTSAHRTFFLSARRPYAQEQEEEEKSTKESAEETVEEAKETAETYAEKAKDAASSAYESASDAVESARETISTIGIGEKDSNKDVEDTPLPNQSSSAVYGHGPETAPQGGMAYPSSVPGGLDRQPISPRNPRESTVPPGNFLYVGNLFFEVSEATLAQEFERFGSIKHSKIIYDARGLSKGFGYVEFEDASAATAAQRQMDGQVLEGRRMSVQYAIKKKNIDRVADAKGFTQPPSSTLFIGNMSYDMSDKDLNDMFKQLKNVVDVRVAIDRRTGMPRGFAHADFTNTESAGEAAEFLKSREFHGRMLRIDYSESTPRRPGMGRPPPPPQQQQE